MKQLFKSLIYNKLVGNFSLKLLLNLHTRLYNIVGGLSTYLNDGIHPKHKIIKYEQWFLKNFNSDDVLIDIGCNTGIMTESLSHKAKFIYGIEILENLKKIAKNKQKRKNLEFICGDATIYDYNKLKKIDCVTLSNVLEHIDDRVGFLKKLSLQIPWKNKKKFLIRVPMIDRDWLTLFKNELELEYRLDKTHFIEYSIQKFKTEMEESKLSIYNFHVQYGELYAICYAK